MPISDSVTVKIDYPPNPIRRWGVDEHGVRRPACEAIEVLLARNAEHIHSFVRAAGKIGNAVLGEVSLDTGETDAAPRWGQTWLPALDAISVVTALGTNKPRTYLEIGSGHSTRFARLAIERLGLQTRLVSIDPQPRAEIDAICDTVIRDRLEDTDLRVFDGLVAGDVVFFDGSHRCLQNSDVTVFFLEVVPRLAPGVLIGVHDIFWPSDYPPGFAGRWYSEQYILGAYLLGLGDRGRIHMATSSLSQAQRDTMLSAISEETLAAIPSPGGGIAVVRGGVGVLVFRWGILIRRRFCLGDCFGMNP